MEHDGIHRFSRESPSPRYQKLAALYKHAHTEGLAPGTDAAHLFGGNSLLPHCRKIRSLIEATRAKEILDYGCGKGAIYKRDRVSLPEGEEVGSLLDYWGVDSIILYDPGVAEYSALPVRTFDGVVCTDVLEHIPEEDIPWVLDELFAFADRFLFANIASYPAQKTLPNGWNAHVTVKSPEWWGERIADAAKGWRGGHYLFEIQEQRLGVGRLMAKVLRMGKKKSTKIGVG